MEKKSKQSLFWLGFFLVGGFALSTTVYFHLSKEQRAHIEVSLKLINEDGRAVTGFSIHRNNQEIGRFNSFGEWHHSFRDEPQRPFLLSLRSYLAGKYFSKEVQVLFEDNKEGLYSFEGVVVLPSELSLSD